MSFVLALFILLSENSLGFFLPPPGSPYVYNNRHHHHFSFFPSVFLTSFIFLALERKKLGEIMKFSQELSSGEMSDDRRIDFSWHKKGVNGKKEGKTKMERHLFCQFPSIYSDFLHALGYVRSYMTWGYNVCMYWWLCLPAFLAFTLAI